MEIILNSYAVIYLIQMSQMVMEKHKPINVEQKVAQVVDKVFEIEQTALKYPTEKASAIRANYNDLVGTIADIVRSEVPDLRNEEDLFIMVSSVAYSNADIQYEKKATLMQGLEGESFSLNCYSSAVLFADVLSKLGVSVNAIKTPDHILISGKQFAFETTADPEESVYSLNKIRSLYSIHQTGSPELLVSSAYLFAGMILAKRGENLAAVEAYEKASAINPKDPEVLFNLGIAYFNVGRYNDSINSYAKSLKIDPNNGEAYFGMGAAYFNKREYSTAKKQYEASLKKKRVNTADSKVREYIKKSEDAAKKFGR